MAVQRVTQTEMTSPVEYRYRPALRRPPVPVPRGGTTVAEQIARLADDYQRALFCRKRAEGARRQWFAGSQREIGYVMARADAGDPRFKKMTYGQLEMIGRWRWSQSSRGQYLMNVDEKFTQWAQMYLSFAEMEVLNHHGVPRR